MTTWLVNRLLRRLGISWTLFNRFTLDAMIVLWALATALDWVVSLRFVSHVSMLALVIGALSTVRSDEPADPEEAD